MFILSQIFIDSPFSSIFSFLEDYQGENDLPGLLWGISSPIPLSPLIWSSLSIVSGVDILEYRANDSRGVSRSGYHHAKLDQCLKFNIP